MAIRCRHGGDAVGLARGILDWGGVQQKEEFGPTTVGQVFWNALKDSMIYEEARMNSGWTKVAAFATAHLENEEERHPQAIWDSRVSTAIIWRLDQLLTAAGAGQVPEVFRHVGYVIGRGGSRPRDLQLKWSYGYGKWECQFAGSDVVKTMRDVLNRCRRPKTADLYPPMPLPAGGTGRWTVRGVEMVLFGDGY